MEIFKDHDGRVKNGIKAISMHVQHGEFGFEIWVKYQPKGRAYWVVCNGEGEVLRHVFDGEE